jgi:hypothetical protein
MVFGVGDLYQQLLAEFNVGLYRWSSSRTLLIFSKNCT